MPSVRQKELFLTPLNVFLDENFRRRKAKNSKYSLRAFARDLQIPASKLSEIMSGKSSPGQALTAKLIEALRLEDNEASVLQKMIAKHKELQRKTRGARILKADEYAEIAGLEHYAIIHLLETEGCQHDARWISQRLQISLEKTIEAIARMQRLGLIRVASGKITPAHNRRTTGAVSTEAIRESHRQVLQHATECISSVAVTDRDITSITFAVNKENIIEAKELIKEFRRKMASFLSKGPKTEVYNLNVQLVPMSYPVKEEML